MSRIRLLIPNATNLAERRAIGEQLRATRAALVLLQRLGAEAVPKAQAALRKQLAALADQTARAMRLEERLRTTKDALASATCLLEALAEKETLSGQRIDALEESLCKARADLELAQAKLGADRAKCDDLAKLVQMEQAEQPVGPPERVDPVGTALFMAVSAVSRGKKPVGHALLAPAHPRPSYHARAVRRRR